MPRDGSQCNDGLNCIEHYDEYRETIDVHETNDGARSGSYGDLKADVDRDNRVDKRMEDSLHNMVKVRKLGRLASMHSFLVRCFQDTLEDMSNVHLDMLEVGDDTRVVMIVSTGRLR